MTRLRIARVVVPITLGALELSHPSWSEGTVSEAVAAAGAWWIPLHLLLIVGYAALVRSLWLPATFTRALLATFLLCNTAFLLVDGVAVGLLATSDPAAADALWNSPMVTILANLTGATWAASLLAIAATRHGATNSTPVKVGVVVTWILFVTSVFAVPQLFSRLAAATTGALIVYSKGAAGISAALLVFAAVLHQHVGPEAALGLVLVGLAVARLPEPG